jgi:hypothetical protein
MCVRLDSQEATLTVLCYIQDASLVDKAAEADFALVFAATRAIRSLAAQYNLQKNVDGM